MLTALIFTFEVKKLKKNLFKLTFKYFFRHYGYNNHGYGYRNNYNYGRNNYHNRHNYGNRRNSNANALALGFLGGLKGAILAPAILAGKAAFLSALG